MLILPNTTDAIEAILTDAPATNNVEVVASWRDITSSAFTPGRTVITVDEAGSDIVPGPAASTQRVVDEINIFNPDTQSHEVTVKYDANGTEYILWRDVLESGQKLTYLDGAGWIVSEIYKPLKAFAFHAAASGNFVMTNATLAERFAGNTTRHLFMVDLLGYKQVRLRANKQVGSASVNTPLFRVKYYSSYNTTVTNFLQLGASAQVEISMTSTGYTDTGWIDMATGARQNGICIGFTELGGDGVADPALGATDILFR